jgi:colicin import membrane protein
MDFRRSLIASICFHVFLLLVGFITFPAIAPHQTEAIASIPVDLISEDPQVKGAKNAQKLEQPAARQTPTPVVQPDDVKPIEEKKPVEPKTAPEKPEETVTAPPEEKEKPVEKAEKKPDVEDPDGILKKIEEAKKKEEEKKKAEEKKKIAEEKKKAEEQRLTKQAAKFDADKISNLLNKQEGAQAPKTEEGSEQKQASLGNPKGEGKTLTQSQQGLMNEMIQKQVLPCYSPPLGASSLDFIVKLKIIMNRDGSVKGQPEVTNSDSHPMFRAVADAARRAILRCSPLKLPAEWYDGALGWNEITYEAKPDAF